MSLTNHHIQLPPNAGVPLEPEIEASWRTLLLLFVGGASTAAGLFFGTWLLFLIGLGMWSALLLALLQFRIDIQQTLDQKNLSASYDLGPHSFFPGVQRSIQLHIEGNSALLQIQQLRIHHSAYLTTNELLTLKRPWHLLPGQKNHIPIELSTPVQGKFAIHGAELLVQDRWSLFQIWRYVQTHQWLRVLPRTQQARNQRRNRAVHAFYNQQIGVPQRQIGTGSELRDIREYQPGDSRRSIVWKHSLRHRKLLCRQFESEIPFSTYLLLDMGQSMREGKLGRRKLDHASQVVATFAKNVLDQRDSLGLISFDGEIHKHDKPSHGQRQYQRVLQHLEQVQRVNQPEFCALSLGEICHIVGKFLYREGILSDPKGKQLASARTVVEYVWDYLIHQPNMKFPQGWESEKELVGLVLRSFCHGVGIDLPYRYHQWVTYKASGLEQAIQTAANNLQSGQLIVVFSDLGDILHWDGILHALRLVRQKKHRLLFISPFSPWFANLPELDEELRPHFFWERWFPTKAQKQQKEKQRTSDILQEILTLEQWTWRRRVQRIVGSLGFPILSVNPEDAPGLLMEQLRRMRLGGRN